MDMKKTVQHGIDNLTMHLDGLTAQIEILTAAIKDARKTADPITRTLIAERSRLYSRRTAIRAELDDMRKWYAAL